MDNQIASSNFTSLEIKGISNLLDWHKLQVLDFEVRLAQFLKNAEAKRIGQQFRNNKTHTVDLGFNVFSLVSDIYHKENFHSDILKAFLDPFSAHKEGYKFLHLFLSLLHSRNPNICIEDYLNTRVLREKGRIDVSIIDDTSKKAIIIENKMNRALDGDRQIPRYVKYLDEQGYEVDAVVYLLPNEIKSPTHENWTAEEKSIVAGKVVVMSAYRNQKDDLVHGWLDPCIQAASQIDSLVLLRQYRLLIKKIAYIDMDKQLMERFHQLMQIDDNFKNAQSVRDLLAGLVNYRVERIIDTFNGEIKTFNKGINRWNHIAFLEDSRTNLVIDICVYEDKYYVEFFNRKTDLGAIDDNSAETILAALEMRNEFELLGKRFRRQFSYPSEESLMYDFVRSLIKRISDKQLDS